MYIKIIYLNLSYSFRQLFYAPISLARKFYFNASESQITHTMWAHLKHTHTHTTWLSHTHTHIQQLIACDGTVSMSLFILPWRAQCPQLSSCPPHSLVITHIFSGLKLNHSPCPFPISFDFEVISGRAQPKTTVNLKELPCLVSSRLVILNRNRDNASMCNDHALAGCVFLSLSLSHLPSPPTPIVITGQPSKLSHFRLPTFFIIYIDESYPYPLIDVYLLIVSCKSLLI